MMIQLFQYSYRHNNDIDNNIDTKYQYRHICTVLLPRDCYCITVFTVLEYNVIHRCGPL